MPRLDSLYFDPFLAGRELEPEPGLPEDTPIKFVVFETREGILVNIFSGELHVRHARDLQSALGLENQAFIGGGYLSERPPGVNVSYCELNLPNGVKRWIYWESHSCSGGGSESPLPWVYGYDQPDDPEFAFAILQKIHDALLAVYS